MACQGLGMRSKYRTGAERSGIPRLEVRDCEMPVRLSMTVLLPALIHGKLPVYNKGRCEVSAKP